MNVSTAIPAALSAFALFTACSAVQSNADDRAAEARGADGPVFVELDPADYEPMPGGYGPGDASEPGAKMAYQIVEEAIYEQFPTRALVDVVALETQVVAGINYRFRVEMTGAPEARAIYEAVVYRSLNDTYELSRLEKIQ
ncbi:MAG: hypothetical protein AAFQ22_15770 [Pseudomonadota bacterium]